MCPCMDFKVFLDICTALTFKKEEEEEETLGCTVFMTLNLVTSCCKNKSQNQTTSTFFTCTHKWRSSKVGNGRMRSEEGSHNHLCLRNGRRGRGRVGIQQTQNCVWYWIITSQLITPRLLSPAPETLHRYSKSACCLSTTQKERLAEGLMHALQPFSV